MQELIEARDVYLDFVKCPEEKHCLMFLDGDDDGIWQITPEKIKGYIENAWEKLSKSDEIPNLEILRTLELKI